ncbi:hypothetical protein BDV3_000111 [Batrachochytrium dendrobatidis]|uniref:DUF726 domain-containing protein n=1 Tax=Batrachochytrium dendrobatidis (strain JEL423) TaxID=403673 RepID=A0A177WBS8_BATDL|nr:hypothetical protein BDEG_21129 [Batrachochytrium dendrobatidis JEL423]
MEAMDPSKTSPADRDAILSRPLSADILYAYIGLVWLVLQEQERLLEETFCDWEQSRVGQSSKASKVSNGVQHEKIASASSYWYDPLGLKALINMEENKRHPAVRSFVSWKTKLMDGLLTFNKLSLQERAAIAEMSEYGVSVEALSESLRSTIESAEITSKQSNTQNDQYSSQLIRISHVILYNLIFTALKNVAVKTKELRYDARLRVLFRRLSDIIFDTTVSGEYRSQNERDQIKCLVQQDIEHGAAVQIWSEILGTSRTEEKDPSQIKSKHPLMSWQSKYLALGAATVGGGLFIGLTGGMAAPFLSAGLGSLFGYAGMTGAIATGIVEGLGTASGAMAMSTLFGITGGSTTAYSFSRRLKDIQDVDLKLVFDSHPSLNIMICVSGFLLEQHDVEEPWLSLPSKMPFTHIEALQFELDCLQEVGNALHNFWSVHNAMGTLGSRMASGIGVDLPVVSSNDEENSKMDTANQSVATDSVQPITTEALCLTEKKVSNLTLQSEVVPRASLTTPIPQQGVMTSIVSALAWPISLLQSGYLVDSPWELGLLRAESAGHVLAKEILLARLRGHRPVSLIGFSLGAVAILHALQDLAKAGEAGNADAYAIIDSVYLFGIPISGTPSMWFEISSVINGRWVNGYAPNDWMLQFLRRKVLPEAGELDTAGLTPILNIQQMRKAFVHSRHESHNPQHNLHHIRSLGETPTMLPPQHALSADVDLHADPKLKLNEIDRKAKWVENIDVSSIIRHHLDYLECMQKIINLVGFEHIPKPVVPTFDHASPQDTTPIQPLFDADLKLPGGGTETLEKVTLEKKASLNQVLFENPYAEENILVRGIHASNIFSSEADDDADDPSHSTAAWTKRGAGFGRKYDVENMQTTPKSDSATTSDGNEKDLNF